MLSLLHLQSLVAALDHGSLSAAARALGLTQPAVSQHLALLEAGIGQPLLDRRPRGVAATAAGRIAAEHGRRMLAELTAMQLALDELKGGVSGRFRITTTTLIAQSLMLPIVTRLRLTFPDLDVEIVPSNEMLDLGAEEIDLALRLGSPGAGPGRVWRIAELNAVLVAAPGYFANRARPETPEALSALDFVAFGARPGRAVDLTLRNGAARVTVPVQPAFAARDPNLLVHAVETGLGFATSPLFFVARQIADGHLERLLPEYETEPRSLYMVLPEQRPDTTRSRLVRAAILTTLAETPDIRLTRAARDEIAAAG